jgi:hypothetical protein
VKRVNRHLLHRQAACQDRPLPCRPSRVKRRYGPTCSCHVAGGYVMKDGQEFSGHLDPSINGHGPIAGTELTQPPVQTRRDGFDRDATRYLSAATQVSIPYAEFVVSKVMDEPFRALAPTFGVDVPVVVRWALKALRTHAARDYTLLVIFLLALLSAVPLLRPCSSPPKPPDQSSRHPRPDGK